MLVFCKQKTSGKCSTQDSGDLEHEAPKTRTEYANRQAATPQNARLLSFSGFRFDRPQPDRTVQITDYRDYRQYRLAMVLPCKILVSTSLTEAGPGSQNLGTMPGGEQGLHDFSCKCGGCGGSPAQHGEVGDVPGQEM